MTGLAEVGLDDSSWPMFESVNRWRHSFGSKYQQLLDRTTRHLKPRWGATAAILLIYMIRVYLLQGFYVVTYGLGIYTLNLLIGFLSPLNDPEEDDSSTELPINVVTTQETEWKPFMRKVPEFKFWFVPPTPYSLVFPFCDVFPFI